MPSKHELVPLLLSMCLLPTAFALYYRPFSCQLRDFPSLPTEVPTSGAAGSGMGHRWADGEPLCLGTAGLSLLVISGHSIYSSVHAEQPELLSMTFKAVHNLMSVLLSGVPVPSLFSAGISFLQGASSDTSILLSAPTSLCTSFHDHQHQDCCLPAQCLWAE